MTALSQPRWRVASLVVGHDGGDHAAAACRWAASVLPDGAALTVVHAPATGHEPGSDDRDVVTGWLDGVDADRLVVSIEIRSGDVAAELIAVAGEVDADAIVVGHHPAPRFGPRLVGQVTADLLEAADRPVIVVPRHWTPSGEYPVAVAVGTGDADESGPGAGDRSTIEWALDHVDVGAGITLVRGDTPRSLFRPDGWFDVLAYHLDPESVREWVAADLAALAEQVGSDEPIAVAASVGHGRTGPALIEAGHAAQALVVAAHAAPFLPRRVLAPHLRHVITQAPCPVVITPGDSPHA